MTNFVQTTEDIKPAPFIKFGLFDESNYKPNELKKAKETEQKYTPIRVVAGDKIYGTISSFHTIGNNGEVMYLKDVTIVTDDGELEVRIAKIGLSTDLNFKIKIMTEKTIGDEVEIEYLGKQQSPKDKSRELHKVNVK